MSDHIPGESRRIVHLLSGIGSRNFLPDLYDSDALEGGGPARNDHFDRCLQRRRNIGPSDWQKQAKERPMGMIHIGPCSKALN
jgi:hypothetical protein